MNYAIVFACLLIHGVAAKEKQIKLEDIERDNLASERKSKDEVKPPSYHHQQQYYARPPHAAGSTPSQPNVQYGFVPMKNPPNYTPQPQQYQYTGRPEVYQPQLQPQVQYLQTQAYTQPQTQTQTQYVAQPQYLPQAAYPPQYHQPQGVQYSYSQDGPKETHAYIQPAPKEAQYVPPPQTFAQEFSKDFLQHYVQQQGYQTTAPQSGTEHQPQQQIQYIVDNHLPQQSTRQQKYYQVPQSPQYVYVQPFQAASNNVHSVTDTKGNVQYVMYVPANYLKGDPNYESILQSYATPQNYIQNDQTTTQYVYQQEPQAGVKYTSEAQPGIKYAPQEAKYSPGVKYLPEPSGKNSQKPSVKYSTGVKYATEYYPEEYKVQPQPQPQPQPQHQQQQTYNPLPFVPEKVSQPGLRRQPTSLLDSYVPSILQYQYYKQQEAANAINGVQKLPSGSSGEKSEGKSYTSIQNQAGSQVSYRFRHPAAYLPHGTKP